jgi:hypothetical protein
MLLLTQPAKAIIRHLPKPRHRDLFRVGHSLDSQVLPHTAVGRLAAEHPRLGNRTTQIREPD